MNQDNPALAASLMVGALCLLALQDSLVKLASADISLWQFQFMRAGFNLTMLLLLARFMWGNSSPRPKRLWTVVLRSSFDRWNGGFYATAVHCKGKLLHSKTVVPSRSS